MRFAHAIARAPGNNFADGLADRRQVVRMEVPALLDRGDVLVADRKVFVGLSGRTNETGVASLRALL